MNSSPIKIIEDRLNNNLKERISASKVVYSNEDYIKLCKVELRDVINQMEMQHKKFNFNMLVKVTKDGKRFISLIA